MNHLLEAPKLLFLLLPIPILVVLFARYLFWKKKAQKQFGSSEALEKLSPTKSTFKPILKFSLVLLSLVLLIVALVNPKIGTKMEKVELKGIDVVFALDISKSMLAEDVKPNRLEKGKQIINEIINQLGNDRVGIVGYAGSAYPVLPMTTDYSIAKMYLQNMNTYMISSQGTALNDAINLSTTYFDAVDTSKLIILISDGEDHNNGAEQALVLAKQRNIKILTIGIGTEKGAVIPIKADNNVVIENKKDEKGETVITKLNPEILQQIAKATNQKYIQSSSINTIVSEVKKSLDGIEKTSFETEQIADYQTQYQWFAGFAFLLLFVDIFLFERKTAWLNKLNLFNEK